MKYSYWIFMYAFDKLWIIYQNISNEVYLCIILDGHKCKENIK
jgi:hypothetical protein